MADKPDKSIRYGGPAGVTVIMRGKVSKPLAPGQVDIIDGDTVRIDGQPYRLVGFDTPESGLTARCERERDLAARERHCDCARSLPRAGSSGRAYHARVSLEWKALQGATMGACAEC